jgi:GNAT superfamily N-acetyltransferase
MIRLGAPADLIAVNGVYRRASLSNAGDRDELLAHPEYLIMGPEGLTEGRTQVAEEGGEVVGFATWARADGALELADATRELTDGAAELEDLFVDPAWMRRGIATALVGRIVDILRRQGAERLELTASPHALAFYRAVGFIDCGVTETALGPAPRMVLTLR